MKREVTIRHIRTIPALLLSFVIIAASIAILPAGEASAAVKYSSFSEYAAKYEEFINDSRWRSGTSWGDYQTPKLGGYSIGCCAYTTDFAKYVFGSSIGYPDSTNPSDIRSGDIVHYTYKSYSGSTWQHWFCVLERNEDALYTAEGNYGNRVRVSSWGYSVNGNKLYAGGDYVLSVEVYHYLPANLEPEEVPESYFQRIYGLNRYETSELIARESLKLREDGSKFPALVIASGENFPDALSGGPLAIKLGCPVLLTKTYPDTEKKTLSAVQDLVEAGSNIYILGGETIISHRFETNLSKLGYKVIRLFGANRYETNLKILNEMEQLGYLDTDNRLLICNGDYFADAMSASWVGAPMLLISGELSDAQNEFLKSHSSFDSYLVGGAGVISTGIEQYLSNMMKSVKRLCIGVTTGNRYGTSCAIMEEFADDTEPEAVLAYGNNFPDGLCGGPFAAQQNDPMLLCDNDPDKYHLVGKVAGEHSVSFCYVLGGRSLINKKAARYVALRYKEAA